MSLIAATTTPLTPELSVKSDLLLLKKPKQHSPPASPSSSSPSSITPLVSDDYSPLSPSSPSPIVPAAAAAPAIKSPPSKQPEEPAANNNSSSNNNFNVFIGRHQVSVVVLKHQGINGRHPKDAGKFYYQARIRNEYPQRHIWSGWANRDEVVAKISVLLNATPDTKIETVPTQNPSKRQAGDSSSSASASATRRQSTQRRQSVTSLAKQEPAASTSSSTSSSRRKASRGDDLADVAERIQKKAKTQQGGLAPSSSDLSSSHNQQVSLGHLSHHVATQFPPTTTHPLQFSSLSYLPSLYYPVFPQVPSSGTQNATFQLLSLAAGNVAYSPPPQTAHPIFPVADPAAAMIPPTSPVVSRNSEMESLIILAGLERQQLDRSG